MSWFQMVGMVMGVLALSVEPARADEPGGETLPAPRAVPAPVVVAPARVVFIRPNPYDVWQYRAVDNYGRFRPRVVPAPGGLRDLATGEPYPWWQNYPQNFEKAVLQVASFHPMPYAEE